METGELATRLREAKPPLGENLVVLATATSTNDVARDIVGALPRETPICDLVVVAGEQTQGRGREERSWWSPPGGGLYATVVWGLDDTELLPRVPLAVAVALCETIREIGVEACRVKWPNDLVVDGRKLGGILIETAGPTAGPRCAIVGVGINVEVDREELEKVEGTSLALESSDPPGLAELAIRSVRAVRAELAALGAGSGLVERYRDLIAHRRGERIVWRQGREIVEGYYRRIDAAGFLELETESGLRVVNAGEIITG